MAGLFPFSPPDRLSFSIQQHFYLPSSFSLLHSYSELPESLSKSLSVYLSIFISLKDTESDFQRFLGGVKKDGYLQYIVTRNALEFHPGLGTYSAGINSELQELIDSTALPYPDIGPATLDFYKFTVLATKFEVNLVIFEGFNDPKWCFSLNNCSENKTIAVFFYMNKAFYLNFNDFPLKNLLKQMDKTLKSLTKIDNLRKLPVLTDYIYTKIHKLSKIVSKNAKILLNCPEICDFQLCFLHQVCKKYLNLPLTSAYPLGFKLKCGHWTETPPASSTSLVCPTCNSTAIPYSALEKLLSYEELSSLTRENVCSQCSKPSNYPFNSVCGHLICIGCVFFAILERKPICQICEIYQSQRNLDAFGQFQCFLCKELKFLSKFPMILCKNSLICYDCHESSVFCPLDNHQFTQFERNMVTNTFFECVKCKKDVNLRKKCAELSCFCEICEKCCDDLRVKTGNLEICPLCKSKILSKFTITVENRIKAKIDVRNRVNPVEEEKKEWNMEEISVDLLEIDSQIDVSVIDTLEILPRGHADPPSLGETGERKGSLTK